MQEAESIQAPGADSPQSRSPNPPRRRSLAPSDYPESDGKPMAETPVHWRATVDATDPLHEFYRQREDVYVGSDMMMYYQEGDTRRSVVPDVWVAFGVPKLPERRTWLIWLEGKGPDFVVEITSKSTRREDENRKKALYERLGVREYWQFDPTGDYLDPILKGRELGPDGAYRDLKLERRDGLLRHSSLLGLELHLVEGWLRYFDPAQNDYLLTYTEQHHARRSAESARLTAESARRSAESARLTAESARQQAESEQHQAVLASQQAESERQQAVLASQQAESARRAEETARRAAETRIAELERQLRGERGE